MAIARAAGRRLIAARTFQRRQPVIAAIGGARNCLRFALRKSVQFRFRNREDTLLRTDPEPPVSVVQDLADDIIGQTFLRSESVEMAVTKSEQPTSECPNPDRSVAVSA